MRLVLIVGLTLGAVAVVSVLPSIPQSQSYHQFADQRRLLGVSNFLNVFSNAPLFLVAILGLFYLWQQGTAHRGSAFVERKEQWPYLVLFLGVGLTCFGSAYYHLAPNNSRLFWDRLPMTLVFMSFFAIIITEWINVKAGLLLLLPLLIFGAGSVIYWHWSELHGAGDLRLYILAQFYPMFAIPFILLLFSARYTRSMDLWVVFGLYAAAKLFELLDGKIFSLGQIVSGHTLKHLA
ncbi:MAG: alkaline phytoceramidase, partial [bacterium]